MVFGSCLDIILNNVRITISHPGLDFYILYILYSSTTLLLYSSTSLLLYNQNTNIKIVDWLGFYVWAINDFKIEKAIPASLILMPFFRWLGDISNYVLKQVFDTPNAIAPAALPAIFWYTGEVFGDSYLPIKTLALCGSSTKKRWAVFLGFGLFVATKVAQVIFRYTSVALQTSPAVFFSRVSYLDGAVCFTGVLSDAICCLIMYQSSTEILQFSQATQVRSLMTTIKNSSFARMTILLIIKIINGIFLVTHPCTIDSMVCSFGFLRSLITTLDYQMYYLDYLLCKHLKYTRNGDYETDEIPSNDEKA